MATSLIHTINNAACFESPGTAEAFSKLKGQDVVAESHCPANYVDFGPLNLYPGVFLKLNPMLMASHNKKPTAAPAQKKESETHL
eukprot:NODE_7167_length_330_cov_40.085409_g6430_i0.p1 GENE.NODE_7167_length_330_cov_40.085409_g6430_i0~~NODE_7167_length_330_cov_40.085409_g6430_i0.p1  ORF type:complete len:85 (-),score=29.01 NODE_7167_length_330_cov_40.085409_g6430_i0:14-268(-)